MSIRDATALDKTLVLKFCKDTFFWGDYINQVWDFWLSEGHLLLFEKQSPVGICHAIYTSDQVWIEGIRIDPSFRRQNIASKLIKHAESIGRKKSISFSHMFIDAKNTTSLSLASSLGYDIFQTWNFYSLESKTSSNHDNIHFEKSLDRRLYSHYVKSWRWLPIDDSALSILYKKNQIIKSCIDGSTSVAILSDSEHFDNTLIVTLFSDSASTALQIISFLQNHGMENHYEKIQILTREQLSISDSLKHRISFHLMKKHL